MVRRPQFEKRCSTGYPWRHHIRRNSLLVGSVVQTNSCYLGSGCKLIYGPRFDSALKEINSHSFTHQELQPMQGLGRLKKPPPIISISGPGPPVPDSQLLSLLTPSIHLKFDLLLCLLPSCLSKVIFLHGRLSCIRVTCPTHLSLVICCNQISQKR